MTNLFVFAFLLAAQDKPPEKCTLSGIVVDWQTGDPLTKVQVFAQLGTDGAAGNFGTVTDDKGRFTLIDLEPGLYRLKGHRNRYMDGAYGARRAGGEGSTLTLAAGQELKNLTIKLPSFAVIGGVVRDSDGEPVAGAEITIFRSVINGGRRMVTDDNKITTDDLGQYRLALPP